MGRRDEQSAEVAHGVEALIERLREEGVERGRAEAERLVEEARERRRKILEEADAEAQRRLDAAQAEVERMKETADQALRTAARDTVLTLREQMVERFKEDIRRLVSEELREEDVFRRMILTVAARVRESLDEDGERRVEVEQPRDPPGLEEIRRDPDRLGAEELSRLVVSMTGDILREGLSFRVSPDNRDGIRVTATESGLEFDMTNEAIAELIRAHLQPRFRALLEGILR
jgi:V/A-type H+-transporting ATPase subunit E